MTNEHEIASTTRRLCPDCKGSSYQDEEGEIDCPTCGGTGVIFLRIVARTPCDGGFSKAEGEGSTMALAMRFVVNIHGELNDESEEDADSLAKTLEYHAKQWAEKHGLKAELIEE